VGCPGSDCAFALLAAASEKNAAVAANIFRLAREVLFTIHPALAYSTDRKYSQNAKEQIFLLGRAFQRCE
jgi:hypothetical protein